MYARDVRTRSCGSEDYAAAKWKGAEVRPQDARCLSARTWVKVQVISPGKLIENVHIESFNSRVREECLSQHVLFSLDHDRE
ncbi:integrase core domain-containing protein [Burkholderia cepacia]|uniref:integrase core domain-containing protein n=1 Tax=Burkholderia cepacia TaxID=292 RepID=UPI000A692C66